MAIHHSLTSFAAHSLNNAFPTNLSTIYLTMIRRLSGIFEQKLSLADIQLHAQIGNQITKFKIPGASNDSLIGSETRLSLLWGPFQVFPLAFGAAFSQLQYQDEFPIHGNEIDLEAEIWRNLCDPCMNCRLITVVEFLFCIHKC
ncbi:MAG: hypothetical protein H7318_19970 [Oligoflexus sp.]|nr:hypothetical protein [Oligoflexus sp.]